MELVLKTVITNLANLTTLATLANLGMCMFVFCVFFATSAPIMAAVVANEKAAINDIKYSVLPGGKVQIDIDTNQPIELPKRFSTSQPARVVLDFFGVSNATRTRFIPVNEGALETISLLQTSGRLRVVLNLLKNVTLKTRRRDDGLTMVVAGLGEGIGIPQAKISEFDRKSVESEFTIERVDFHRTPNGGGKVEVDLSQLGFVADVKRQGDELIVDFLKTSVEQALEKRLNVVDFATPVNTIDTFASGTNTRIIIKTNSDYRHLAFQTDRSFTLQILPGVEEEEAVQTDEFGYSGEKLSLNFHKIGVREALGVLADFTGINFVTSDSVSDDSVSDNLTLRLQDVPWDQALDVILQAKGLAKREKGNVIWVASQEDIQEQERLALEATKQVAELEPLASELIQINYAKAVDIQNLLKSIKSVDTGVTQSLFGSVSIAEMQTDSNSLLSVRGQVTVDKRTNTLLIQDTASKLREVHKLITKLDRPVRQVMIETRIVEATDDFSRNLGVRLGFSRTDTEGNERGEPSRVNVDLPANESSKGTASSLGFTIAKAGNGFQRLIDLEISALQAKGQGKIIANPRLVTANQKEAHIEQGQERIFTTSILGVGSVVTKKAVLGLTVTPQITPNDRVILDVFITQDAFVSSTEPIINTKQIKTQVLLENGETVVIGGIYQQTQNNTIVKTPILGDVPLLGNLFKKSSKSDNRTELLVFLTPKILSPALSL